MTMVDSAKQHAAKLAGVFYLITFIIVVSANYGIYDPLHVSGDVNETARRISAHRYLFRFAIVLDLLYAVGFTILISCLYTVLRDVNRRVTVIATFWHLVYIIVWVAFTLKFFDALRLASGPKYLDVFAAENLNSLARLFLWARFDRYYGGLLFYSLGSMLFNYLWLKSGYIPKPLAVVGIIACAWCAMCTVGYLIYPSLENILDVWFYDTAMALFDLTLSIWLITKGLRK
jgi:hypothetical protein